MREPAKLTALQPALRTKPARSTEAQRWSAFRLPARASDIDRSNRWPGINSESSATSIPAGSDAARTESHAFLQPAGVDSRRTNLAFSSYAENRAAAEAPQPMRARAGAAERKRAVRREAAFSLSVFTAPPIRLLFCCRKAASHRLPSYLHARRSRDFRSAVLGRSRRFGLAGALGCLSPGRPLPSPQE